MKFKLGEFVRFVEEKREGFITRIIDNETIAVTDDDGFEIPVLASQVTRVHGKSQPLEEVQEDLSVVEKEFQSKGVFLAISADKQAANVAHFHLVNTSSFKLLISFSTLKNEIHKGKYHGILNQDTTVPIYSASFNELDTWPEFNLQILKFSPQTHSLEHPIFHTQKFRAKDFSQIKKTIPLLNTLGWLIPLDEQATFIDPVKLKESFFTVKESKPTIEHPGKILDLHIERLREDYQFLSSSEILDFQLNAFQKALDAAIVHKTGSITFIHGLGNGTLRDKIHKTLSKHVQVKTFMDAFKEKFGYGATEVILK